MLTSLGSGKLLKFGPQLIRLTQENEGSWVGPTKEPGIMLCLRQDGPRFMASLEDHQRQPLICGTPGYSPELAAATLLRQAKRLLRASALKVL